MSVRNVATEKKRIRNKSVRSLVKTKVTQAEENIFSGDVESAEKAVAIAVSTLDKAAEKGILPANNAARRKARLVKKLNNAKASKETKETKKKAK